MATYTELRALFHDSDLLERAEVSVIVAANGLADNAANNDWVATAFSSPNSEAKKVLMGIIAANSDADISVIQSSTDAQLQVQADLVVATLVAAKAGV